MKRIFLLLLTSVISAASEKTSAFEVLVTYTFLTAREGGLAVSYDTEVRSDNDLSTVTNPTVDPRSGFRLQAAYIFNHYHWDLTFSYRWFYNRDNPYREASLPETTDENSIYATWALALNKDPRGVGRRFVPGLSSSAWNNSFNRIDLSLGRSLYISHVLLRPYLGMLFAWDDQDYIVSYGYKDGVSMTPTVAEWRNSQNWYGIGPYVGLHPSFILWSNHTNTLSISGRSGAALTWSKADTAMWVYSTDEPPISDTDLMLQYRDIFLYISPMIELSLGLSWESILHESYSIKGYIGWEQESWFEHNRMFDLHNYPPSGGLYSMQGLNISIGVGF